MAVKTNYTANGKNYFRISASFGRDANGKLIRKYFYGKSQKEAQQKLEDYKFGLKNGLTINSDVMLSGAIKTWLFEFIKGSIKDSCFDRYECTYRTYLKYAPFCNKYIKDITALDIQRYYNDLFKNGKSTSSIKRADKLLKRFFKYSISEGFILRNPCDNIKIPKDFYTAAAEVEIFSKEDLKLIINYTDNYPKLIKYIALASLATGMRQGEVLGLKWDDIDLDSKEISIQRTLTCYTAIIGEERKLVRDIHSPKTKNSIRKIPLPDSLIPILKEIKKQQNINILKAGTYYKDEYKGFIFLTKDGNLIHKSWADTSWRNYLKKCNVKHKKFHALRHTYATLQFENDVPLKTVSILLGHSTISITADIYTHVLKKEKEKTMDIINVLNMC